MGEGDVMFETVKSNQAKHVPDNIGWRNPVCCWSVPNSATCAWQDVGLLGVYIKACLWALGMAEHAYVLHLDRYAMEVRQRLPNLREALPQVGVPQWIADRVAEDATVTLANQELWQENVVLVPRRPGVCGEGIEPKGGEVQFLCCVLVARLVGRQKCQPKKRCCLQAGGDLDGDGLVVTADIEVRRILRSTRTTQPFCGPDRAQETFELHHFSLVVPTPRLRSDCCNPPEASEMRDPVSK